MELKRLLITIALVVFAAGAVGGSTYYVMGAQSKKEKEEFEKQIQALEKQVSEVQREGKEEPKAGENNQDSSSQKATDPSIVVKGFADYYFSDNSSHNSEKTYTYFTSNFAKTIKQRYADGAPADPIFGVQDYPTNNSAKTVTSVNGSATVSLTLGYAIPVTKTITLTLVNGNWLIDNVK